MWSESQYGYQARDRPPKVLTAWPAPYRDRAGRCARRDLAALIAAHLDGGPAPGGLCAIHG
jgi:hypothetical protein